MSGGRNIFFCIWQLCASVTMWETGRQLFANLTLCLATSAPPKQFQRPPLLMSACDNVKAAQNACTGFGNKLKIFWLNIEQTWCGKCGAEGWKGIRCYVVEKSTMISEDGLRFEPKSTITGSCEYNSWENPYLNAFPKFIHIWKTPMLCNFVNSVSQLTKTVKIIVEIFTNCQNGQ